MIKFIVKHVKKITRRTPSNVPYQLRNTDIDDDFNFDLLFEFFERSKIPFIKALGSYNAAFKFGNDTMEAYDIGNAGLISKYILNNYITEDYPVLFSQACLKLINLMRFIDVDITVGREGCLFHVQKNAKTLENINSFSVFYTSYFIYDERYRITKTKFKDDNVLKKELQIQLDFTGKSSYFETTEKAILVIDYHNPSDSFLNIIEYHKKEFINKLGISENEATINDIYNLYTMLTI